MSWPYPGIRVTRIRDSSTEDDEQQARNISHFVSEHIEFIRMAFMRHVKTQGNSRYNNDERNEYW